MKKYIIKIFLSFFLLFGLALPVFALEVNYPIFGGETIDASTTLTEYVRYIFIFVVSITGFIAVVTLAVGGVQYISSVGNTGKMKEARQKILSSFFGVLLLLSSYVVLYTINPNLTKFQEPTIAQLATAPLPEPPISTVPTEDLLARIKILAEDTKEIPDVIYNSARLIEDITNQCDCNKTKPMCSCQEVLTCPDNPWYTIYDHMDKIDIKEGNEVIKGQAIGEVGKIATDMGPNLYFGLGFLSDGDMFLIDISSKISAPGGSTGSAGDKEPLPGGIKTADINYVLKTLSNPLEYSQCVWYEVKNSSVNTGRNYWAQSWRCQSEDISDSSKVHVLSGGDELISSKPDKEKEGKIQSTVEKVDEEKGEVVIRHKCIKPSPTPTPPPDGNSGNSTTPPADSGNSTTPPSGFNNVKIKSLASIESLGDLTCTFPEQHYFYNNFASEGCCAGSVCGPAGEEKCCSTADGLTCINNENGASCCPTQYKCGGILDPDHQACCSQENPYCTVMFFNAYRKWACTTPEKTKSCFDPKDDKKTVAFCKQTENCVNSADGFSCCDPVDSIICGDPGYQKCFKDPDGNATKDVGTTNIYCGGTKSDPVLIIKDILQCQGNDVKCGPEEGYQTCCPIDLSCRTYDFLENNVFHKKGACCPSDKTNLCYEATSSDPPACCKTDGSEKCIKGTTGFGCCNTTTSKVFGTKGFEKCCPIKDGNPNLYDVIDIGTWNNPICFDIVKPLPFDCVPEKTICGFSGGTQSCCGAGESCNILDLSGYCCLNEKPYLCSAPEINKPPVCCGTTACGISTKSENLCCDGATPQSCDYYMWGFFAGSACCPADSYCSGTWANPTCSEIKPIEEPPVSAGCQRFYISQIKSSGFPTAQYVDICCGETESACFNYKDPESKLCCQTGQLCVNNQSGSSCSCDAATSKVCGDPRLGNQICCGKDQLCGGTTEQAVCINPIPGPSPLPDKTCETYQQTCVKADVQYTLPSGSSYWPSYRSESQGWCETGSTCYLENKSGTPFHPSEYFLYRSFVPHSTGACCPSDKNLWFPGAFSSAFSGYGVCCDKGVDIAVDKNNIGTCCKSDEKACGPTDASNPSVHYGVCCPSDQKCVNNQCQKTPTYCESPVPTPINGEYPAACPCSPTPTPTPETSPQPLKCTDQTCFGEDKYHPCGEVGGKELLFWQNEIVSKEDIMIYYKNRLIAERKDLKTDLEKFIKPTMIWFNKEIQAQLKTSGSEYRVEFLKERMGWLAEEQKYKEDLLNKMEEAEKIFNDFENASKNVSQLPDKCLSNVPSACTSVCTKEGQVPKLVVDPNKPDSVINYTANDGYFAGEKGEDLLFSDGKQLGNYGCHNAFFGCKPIYCAGGNPCPEEEIKEETGKLEELGTKIKNAYDDIIYIILNIKKERVPKITL